MTVGGVAIATVGAITLQPIINKYANRLYKKSLEKERIDIENLGPSIIKSENRNEEKAEITA